MSAERYKTPTITLSPFLPHPPPDPNALQPTPYPFGPTTGQPHRCRSDSRARHCPQWGNKWLSPTTTTVVYSTRHMRPDGFRDPINHIWIPILLILITLPHYHQLMSLAIIDYPRDERWQSNPDGGTSATSRVPETVFHLSPRTPAHHSSIYPSPLRICSPTLGFPFR